MTFKYGDIVRAQAGRRMEGGNYSIDVIGRYIERTTSGDTRILFIKDTPGTPANTRTADMYISRDTILHFRPIDILTSYFENEVVQETFGEILAGML